MDQRSLENMVREILQEVNGGSVKATGATTSGASSLSFADYPLGAKRPELVKTSTNKSLNDITLENVINGAIKPEDVRVTATTLKMQAEIARAAGRETLAVNFERAAELTVVPDERLLEIYNALRPYRSTKVELEAIATELETRFQAIICAAFIREAAVRYVERKKLKGDN